MLVNGVVFAQENANMPQRTPEQEATKQTERLQQELNLTPEQTKQLYEINLKYARERRISNTRSAAMERMKNKNADIQNILTPEQNSRLQYKREESASGMYFESGNNRNPPPPGNRPVKAPDQFRRTTTPERNYRNPNEVYKTQQGNSMQLERQRSPQPNRQSPTTNRPSYTPRPPSTERRPGGFSPLRRN